MKWIPTSIIPLRVKRRVIPHRAWFPRGIEPVDAGMIMISSKGIPVIGMIIKGYENKKIWNGVKINQYP